MVELTSEECAMLEKTVTEKICAALGDDAGGRMYRVMTQTAVRATIATIREYERMKQPH